MSNRLINSVKTNLINFPGWNSKRKLVVFESDDWGMIRMATKEAYHKLMQLGYPLDKSIYNKFDALEQNEDLSALMDVLSSVKDKNGNYAKFTINNIVGNPNFEKIKETYFEQYHVEIFTESLKRNTKSDKVVELYKQGLDNGVFQVQFHGREHVHVNNWLKKLRQKDRSFLDAFDHNMFTINDNRGNSCRYECLDSMAAYSSEDMIQIEDSVRDGLKIFKDLWGFQSESIIAPCYTWNSELEPHFKLNGVQIIQGSRAQRQPILGKSNFQVKRHYLGKRNSDKMVFLLRNVNFEQIESNSSNLVGSALKEIETAFFWKKPAIISSHRVNYIGSLSQKNRNQNLMLLKELLDSILKRFPDVEFMSSDELGREILNNLICVE